MSPSHRAHHCDRCGAAYHRPDHLARHVKTHTGSHAHICRWCQRSFARLDVLRRHARIHEDPDSRTRSERVEKACARCAAMKLKCTAEKPCRRCLNKGVSCEPIAEPKGTTLNADGSFNTTILPVNPHESELSPLLHDALPDLSNETFWGIFADLPDLDVDLDSLFSLAHPSSESFDSLDRLAQAYQDSVLREWSPDSEKQALLTLGPLSLSEVGGNQADPLNERSIFQLTGASRDKLLHMFIQTCSPRNRDELLCAFPSCEVLSRLVDLSYIQDITIRAGQFIHFPSLDINSSPVELVGALVAAGGVLCPSNNVRSFAYAMQEAVRLSLRKVFDDDNSIIRKLPMLQAHILQQRLAIFSSQRRKIEIAESLSAMAGTHLRRAKRMGAASYIRHFPDSSLIGDDLKSSWLQWVDNEAWSRLVYTAFIMDWQLSFIRQIGVGISFAELQAPLPKWRAMWNAPTPEQWLASARTIPQSSITLNQSLASIMADPSLAALASDTYDPDMLYPAIIGAYWALLRQWRELAGLNSQSNIWNNFVLRSRYTELRAMLQDLTVQMARSVVVSSQARILVHAVSLHLHASIEELHTFAGKDSDLDAKEVDTRVQDWYRGPEAVVALCHAGQVFRHMHCRKLANLVFPDICAVAFFHATVVIYVYGIIERRLSGSRPYQNDESSNAILDISSIEVPALLSTGSTKAPGLSGSDGNFVPLWDTASVMRLLRGTLLDGQDRNLLSACTASVLNFIDAMCPSQVSTLVPA